MGYYPDPASWKIMKQVASGIHQGYEQGAHESTEGRALKPMPLGCTALCRPMRGFVLLSKLITEQLRPHPY